MWRKNDLSCCLNANIRCQIFGAWFFWGQIIRNSMLNQLLERDTVPLDTGFGNMQLDALGPWEIPAQCTLEGVELLQMGRYGPICMGQLKQDTTSTAVVIKILKGTQHKSMMKRCPLRIYHTITNMSSCFRWIKSAGGYRICGFLPFPHSSEQTWEYSQDVILPDMPDAHVPGFGGKCSREPPAFSLESSRGKNTNSWVYSQKKRYWGATLSKGTSMCGSLFLPQKKKKKKGNCLLF